MTGMRIVMLNLGAGGHEGDPRVEREARTLGQHGCQLTALGWNRNGKLAEYEKGEGYCIHRMGPPLPPVFDRVSMRFQAATTNVPVKFQLREQPAHRVCLYAQLLNEVSLSSRAELLKMQSR